MKAVVRPPCLSEWNFMNRIAILGCLAIATRNALRHPIYSAINLLGLAIGMACAILLVVYIRHELSYDRFRPEAARTYRVMKQIRHANGRIAWHSGQQGPLATVLPEEFPEVEDAVRFWSGTRQVQYREMAASQLFWLSDPNVFAFFGIEVLAGDPTRSRRTAHTKSRN